MVEPNEIMLDNWLYHKTSKCFAQVKGIITGDFKDSYRLQIVRSDMVRIKNDDVSVRSFDPIPITEEWLKKLGLFYVHDNQKQKPHFEGALLLTIAGLEFSNYDRGGKKGFYSYSIDNGNFIYQHVHQIQNLCNALGYAYIPSFKQHELS